MNQLKEILLSYATAINPTEAQKETAEKRLAVCMDCEHWDNSVIARCKLCGCATKGKVFSPVENPCPEKRWPI